MKHHSRTRARAGSAGRVLLLAPALAACADLPAPGGEPDSLARSMELAVATIGASQTPAGAWLTDYTSGTEYVDVAQQLDVWAPVILLDLLDPVADSEELDQLLERARSFCTDQIEPSGLVRYEGKGSELLPDSDDTTLIWRVAPGDIEAQIPAVLETLDEYREDNGLYSIWLSPGGRTGHSAVGDDPNPADIQTQIHILQFFSVYSPERAAALCSALVPYVSDRGYWTYSEASTWLYVVREIDLASLGCALPRPDALLRTELEHQRAYMDLVRLLRDVVLSADPAPLEQEVRDVLTLLAADDFERVREAPLLLYHNDLTSSVSRFYWSKDLALALWIRLYLEADRNFQNWPDPDRSA